MKILYLDCSMGAAGDMLTAALYELLDENEKVLFIEKMNTLGIPNTTLAAEKAIKCGIVGTYMRVTVDGIEEDTLSHDHVHEHNHSHEDEHEHEHHHHEHIDEHNHSHEHDHSGLEEIERIIDSLSISEQVKQHALAVYKLIAKAESFAHGVPMSEIHFHEVGTMDAIADVTAVCLLMEKLGVEKVTASPVHVGSGHVRCAHGILPVPAPATAYILKGVPIYGGGIKGELCTPTGAALLKHFVNDFEGMPEMKVDRIGYGMGKKDFSAANCVRAMLGETVDSINQIIELTCNLDDITPERVGYAIERLFEAGALDVFTVSVGMKKSRPGTMLCVLCNQEKRDQMIYSIFKHTTTLGIRENISRRYTLQRRVEKVETIYGEVQVKYSEGYGVKKEKYEYKDLVRIANEKEISLDEVVRTIENGRK